MLTLLNLIGARPQFIKAAAINRAIRKHFSGQVREVIVHTGQHYDHEMSEVFFQELQIPHEDYNFGIGSASHGVQIAKMIMAVEEVINKERPDGIILYGDTNSTLAGAIAASKLCIPIIHVEAGMRSFTKNVPEEINRVLCDHVSTLLFTPTLTGADNLYREGFFKNNVGPYTIDNPKVILCGDIMYDNSLYFRKIAISKSPILANLKVKPGSYSLVTVHRDNNTNDPAQLSAIFNSLISIIKLTNALFILPLHPRTNRIIAEHPELRTLISKSENIMVLPPASYFDMMALISNADMIITDSGGVQKEAYYFEKPCIILQNETPWVELVNSGCAKLAGADPIRIEAAYGHFMQESGKLNFNTIFGDGNAAEFIVKEILMNLNK